MEYLIDLKHIAQKSTESIGNFSLLLASYLV
jgi:hypothetical protein